MKNLLNLLANAVTRARGGFLSWAVFWNGLGIVVGVHVHIFAVQIICTARCLGTTRPHKCHEGKNDVQHQHYRGLNFCAWYISVR